VGTDAGIDDRDVDVDPWQVFAVDAGEVVQRGADPPDSGRLVWAAS
jgi:hypothetical protein